MEDYISVSRWKSGQDDTILKAYSTYHARRMVHAEQFLFSFCAAQPDGMLPTDRHVKACVRRALALKNRKVSQKTVTRLAYVPESSFSNGETMEGCMSGKKVSKEHRIVPVTIDHYFKKNKPPSKAIQQISNSPALPLDHDDISARPLMKKRYKTSSRNDSSSVTVNRSFRKEKRRSTIMPRESDLKHAKLSKLMPTTPFAEPSTPIHNDIMGQPNSDTRSERSPTELKEIKAVRFHEPVEVIQGRKDSEQQFQECVQRNLSPAYHSTGKRYDLHISTAQYELRKFVQLNIVPNDIEELDSDFQDT